MKAIGLTKVFSGTIAVKDVNIEMQGGQVVVVVGENGAGKTTLKNLLCGILEPDRGKIEFEGKKFHISMLRNMVLQLLTYDLGAICLFSRSR